MSEPDLYTLIREHIPKRYQDDYRLAVRDAIRLMHAKDDDEIVGWLGGAPVLPEGFDWPRTEGHYYEHVATIDLGKLPAIDLNLPDAGTISLFHDGGGIVCWFPAGVATTEADIPSRLVDQRRAYPRIPLTCRIIPTLPTCYEMPLPALDDWEDEFDELLFEAAEKFDAARSAVTEPWHQIGGWSYQIQGENDRGVLPGSAAEQRFYSHRDLPEGQLLLVQIDHDGGNGIGFGDMGMFYCFIAPEDLAAGNLGAAVAYSESH
ncbi:YwqG family protein [Nocardia sp. NPDC050378]|uniref:YwqG family protein n=1 Tax=Nocardia sp. NPDC050378 TaxID=3155400 RepID=UPI0033F989DD